MAEVGHTAGPWEWWTSNSWRRLRHSDRGVSTNVLMPTVCRDGQADIDVSQADMELIAASPDLADAAMDAWRALMWIMAYDSEDRVLQRAVDRLEAAISKAGTYDFVGMRALVEKRARAALLKATPSPANARGTEK